MNLAQFRPGRSVLLRVVLSVILSVLLWGWVTSLADPELSRSASNVRVANGVPGEGLVVSTTQIVADVNASGPESVIEDFTNSSLALTLDLGGIDQPGTYTVPIVPIDQRRFIHYDVTPATTSIVVDDLISRVFPVDVETLPAGQNDRQVTGQRLSVPEVTVSGPRSIMDTIVRTQVDVDITGQNGEFSVTAPVYAVTVDGNEIDSTIQNVTINPSYVDLTIAVQSIGREVTILADVVGSPAEGFEQRTSTTTPRTVRLSGPADVLANLTFVETESVDISGATQTLSTDVGIANLPEGVQLIEPANGLVSVIVQIQQQSVDQTLPNLPVTITGASPDVIVTASPAQVSIEISASSSQVPDLVNGAITVSIDVTGLTPGTYSLTPTVIVPAGVEWDSVTPSTVDITVASAGSTAQPTTIATPITGG